MESINFIKEVFGNNIEMIHDKLDIFNDAYDGYTFKVNNKIIKSRTANKTPKKNGLFVVLWSKNENQMNIPYDENASFDYLMIQDHTNQGFFLLSKEILIEKEILKSKKYSGKMGFRVYTTFDRGLNKSASESQKWQIQHYYLTTSKISSNILIKD